MTQPGRIRVEQLLLLGCAAVFLLLLGLDHSKQPPRVVDAQKFVLRDANGKVWAEFGMQAGGPSLTLLDENGVCRARLALLADGTSQLVFQDRHGNRKASLHVPTNGEPHLEMEKEKENHQRPRDTDAESPASSPASDGEGAVTAPASKNNSNRTRNPATEALYRRLCVTCHGADGRGRKSRSRPNIPDFSDAEWHKRHSDSRILAGILNGRGDGMPSFADSVTKAEAKELLAFIRAFGPASARQPVESSIDDFESRLRQLRRQWDMLDRQLKAISESPSQSDQDR